VKELEKKLALEEAKLQEKLNQAREKQDNTITWNELGVAQLFVGEVDLFENLNFPTRCMRLLLCRARHCPGWCSKMTGG
jgi:N12 class adenine-specific DNA methylase